MLKLHTIMMVGFMAATLLCSSVFSATVDVTSYGAVGTGNEADASTNFSACALAIYAAGDGGTVLVPAGVYYMNASITIGRDNLTLDGYGATIKRVSTGDPAAMSMIYVGTTSGCVVQGLTIDGNRSDRISSPYSNGIVAEYAVGLTIKDCDIRNNPEDGVYITSRVRSDGKRGYARVENCNITYNYRNGISITDSSGGCVIIDCYFANSGLHALDFEPDNHHTANHTVTGCTFDADNLVLYGTLPTALPWGIIIEGCDFVNGADLKCHQAMEVVATNNTFTGGGGIFLNGYYTSQDGYGKIALAGNSVAGVTSNGINLLTNPGFESWTGGIPNNWTPTGTGTYTIESSLLLALEGTKAAHLIAASGNARLKQTISVTAGNYYTFGGYISRDAISGVAYPVITVNFLDAGSAVLKDSDLRAYYEYAKYAIYEKAMGIAKAPAGAVSAEVSIGGESSGSFNAYFDGLFFYEGIGPDDDLTLTDDKVVRFDFGRQGDYPAPGYIHVDSTTAYGTDPNTGLTYGVFGTVIDEDYWGSWQTRNTRDELSLNGLRFENSEEDYSSGFEFEVPNGEYLVTVGAGTVAWNVVGQLFMEGGGGLEGLTYSGTVNSDNLYVVDVIPDTMWSDVHGEFVSDGILTWTQDQDYEKHRVMYYGQIRTWGYYNNNPYWFAAELLYLENQPVTVTDGKLTVHGMAISDGGAGYDLVLNFIEVVRAPVLPPANCNEVWQFGFGLDADFDQDCDVDLADLAEMVGNWLICNDPGDPSCIETW